MDGPTPPKRTASHHRPTGHIRPPDSNRCWIKVQKELEDYWRGALDRISVLEFELDHATWDEKRRELNVVYEDLNGERKRACEIMQFDAAGRQIRGEAFYGAAI
jgi:hypothetical protein